MSKKEIRILIGRGDLKKAIETLVVTTADTPDESTALMLASRLSRLDRKELAGLTDYANANLERNQITQAVLSLVKDMPDTSSTQGAVKQAKAKPLGGDQQAKPKKIVIAYASEDFDYVERLKRFMTPLQRDGLVELWSDSNISAGQSRNKAIQEKMAKADIILYMVSVDFLAADFINKNMRAWAEMHRDNRGTIVVPVIVRPSDWTSEDFAQYNAIPRNERGELVPLSSWGDQDLANMALVEQLRRLINNL